MPGGKSDYLRNKQLLKDFGQTDYSPPSSYFVALFSVSPTSAGGGTELTYTGYARVEIPNDGSHFDLDSVGHVVNLLTIAFPQTESSSPPAVAFALFDTAGGGNMYRYGPVSPQTDIPQGKSPTFDPGSLIVTEA